MLPFLFSLLLLSPLRVSGFQWTDGDDPNRPDPTDTAKQRVQLWDALYGTLERSAGHDSGPRHFHLTSLNSVRRFRPPFRTLSG